MFDTTSTVPNRLSLGSRAPHRVLRFVQVAVAAALGIGVQACAADADEGPGQGSEVSLAEPAVDLKAGCSNGTTNSIEVCSFESSTCLGYKTSGQHCLVTNLTCVVEPDANGVVRGRWEVKNQISYFIEDGSDMICIF